MFHYSADWMPVYLSLSGCVARFFWLSDDDVLDYEDGSDNQL